MRKWYEAQRNIEKARMLYATIDASGFVVTPALVNAHIHISYAHAVRGIFPDDLVGLTRLRQVFRNRAAIARFALDLLDHTRAREPG